MESRPGMGARRALAIAAALLAGGAGAVSLGDLLPPREPLGLPLGAARGSRKPRRRGRFGMPGAKLARKAREGKLGHCR